MCDPFPTIAGEGKKIKGNKVILSSSFATLRQRITSLTSSELHGYFVLFPISQEAFLPHSRETAYGRKILAVQPETTALLLATAVGQAAPI